MEASFNRLRQIDHHDSRSVRLYENVEADDYPPHWHSAFELILPIENDYTVLIGEDTHVLQPQDMIIIPSGTVHEIFAPENGKRCIMMVDQDAIARMTDVSAAMHSFYPCVKLLREDNSTLYQTVLPLFYQVIREYEQDDYFCQAAMLLLLGQMFIAIGRALLGQEGGNQGLPLRNQHQMVALYLDVCSYIAEHCNEPLTLEDMAEYTGYSRFHFARMFKHFAGVSFYDFYMKQRLMLCERLLTDPALSITEAALQAGFGSIATFNRAFKQHKGITPTNFRHMMQHPLQI